MEREFNKPPCGRCKTLKGDSWNDSDCQECLPDIYPENEDAIMIYGKVCNQVIIGNNKMIDINHGPVHSAMELYGVEDKITCFEKVLKLSRHFLSK